MPAEVGKDALRGGEDHGPSNPATLLNRARVLTVRLPDPLALALEKQGSIGG